MHSRSSLPQFLSQYIEQISSVVKSSTGLTISGLTGSSSPIGLTGSIGSTGRGSSGSIGLIGSVGLTGSVGLIGSVGTMTSGSIGFTGSMGSTSIGPMSGLFDSHLVMQFLTHRPAESVNKLQPSLHRSAQSSPPSISMEGILALSNSQHSPLHVNNFQRPH